MPVSIDFLHGGTTASTAPAARHAPRHIWHATFAATCSLVDFHHDRVHDAFKFFLLGFKFLLLCQLVLVQPIQRILHSRFNLVLVACLEFVLELLLLQSVTHGEAIVLETILGFDFGLVRFVLGTVLLRLLHHAIYFRLGETTLLVGDHDLVGLSGGLVLRGHV